MPTDSLGQMVVGPSKATAPTKREHVSFQNVLQTFYGPFNLESATVCIEWMGFQVMWNPAREARPYVNRPDSVKRQNYSKQKHTRRVVCKNSNLNILLSTHSVQQKKYSTKRFYTALRAVSI